MSWSSKAMKPRLTEAERMQRHLMWCLKNEREMSLFDRCMRFICSGVWRRTFARIDGRIVANPPYRHPYSAK